MIVKRNVKSIAHAQRVIKNLNRVPKIAYEEFVTKTPRDTGNAKRSTKFVKGDTIDAAYNYANALNNGSSKQARLGMTIPTISAIRRFLRKAR